MFVVKKPSNGKYHTFLKKQRPLALSYHKYRSKTVPYHHNIIIIIIKNAGHTVEHTAAPQHRPSPPPRPQSSLINNTIIQ